MTKERGEVVVVRGGKCTIIVSNVLSMHQVSIHFELEMISQLQTNSHAQLNFIKNASGVA